MHFFKLRDRQCNNLGNAFISFPAEKQTLSLLTNNSLEFKKCVLL